MGGSTATRPNAAPARMTGGEALARTLAAARVGPMFGMGGFQLLPFYEAVRALGLTHFLINDERTGCFAADAWARVANRPGVCDATLGPGATNLTTALVEALNAGTPMLAIIGGANRDHAGKNMTQEARQAEILRPAAKELIRVESVRRVPELVRRALSVATAGRPGPVVLEVPEDVAHGEHEFRPEEFDLPERITRIPAMRARPDAREVERAAAMLARARRPMLLVGGGVHLSQAYAACQRLVEEQGVPLACTMSGKGAIACTHPLNAGLFGRYSRIANDLIAEADLLLVAGCKLGEIATRRFQLLPPEVPVIQLDIVAEEIGRTSRCDLALWGDCAAGLEDIAEAARGARHDRADWAAQVAPRMAAWREGARERLESAERPINLARVIAELNRLMPDDSVLVGDGGFAGHWTGLLYETKRAGRHYVADRGLASIGYGLPGAIGAQLAVGGRRRVAALTGDGGFNMTLGDLETARRAGAAPVILVVNNAASGYVKALQHAMYGAGNYQSSDLVEMDYAAIARAMGCAGIRVEDPDRVADALRAGLANTDTPTVIDLIVTRDPARMLPATDSRTLRVEKGDRPA
jgi:acetolactate synthase-1/2/3 large subunit